MDIGKIKNALAEFPKERVNVFTSYVTKLATAKKKVGNDWVAANPWMQHVKDGDLTNLFKKVALDGLWINGDSVTLIFRGGLQENYDYQAYKNKLLIVYPESFIDLQLVHEGDITKFSKEKGEEDQNAKVSYKHEIVDPFSLTKTIIGAYCVIKNRRGEFLETINIPEFSKMRNAAKSKKVWDEWLGEMVLKSVIRRGCKRHFKDDFKAMDEVDNLDYELENSVIENELQKSINEADEKGLQKIYEENSGGENEPQLLILLAQRRADLKAQA